MAYEIYTYGNGEILKGVFDAIAMCLNGQSGTLFEPLKRLGLITGTFWAAIYAIYGDQIKVFTSWIVPMVAILHVLFLPSTSVWIHDPVTHYHQKVDHVPYGLAAFAGYVSKIGHLVTEQVERIFSLPDDLRYQKSGSLFASNLIQQAKTFHITNEDMAENMRSFVGQCVVYDAMLGRKYTLEDLRQSDDIWGLVSTQASPVRSMLWRDPRVPDEARARPQIIPCREAVSRFNRLWGQELDRASTLYGKKVFGKNSLINPRTELLKYLPLAYTVLGDMAKSAADILKQQMMIFAVVEGIEHQSTALGNSPNFAARRAYLQQRSTYETLGAMAGETLPTMKAVLEAIAYACFLFVIPLALLPFGYRFLLSWAQILLWLQMWAPLYAILNYIMTMAARSKSLAALSLSNEAGVTIATSVGLANVNADIAAMAGYLAMSIPFLCIALVKGVGSFVHMASHLGNVSQGAASMAAGEVTSGNFSFGNISEGNRQIANTNMMSQSMAANYRASSFQMSDGRMDMTTMADGSQIANIGVSNLPVSLNMAETQSAQYSQMASQSYQKALNQSQASSESLSNSGRTLIDLSERLNHGEQMTDGMNRNIQTEQSRAVNKSMQMIKDFAHQNQIDEGKSAELLMNASFGKGLSTGLFGASVGGGTAVRGSDQEIFTEAQKYAESRDFQQAARESMQAASSLSHTLSDEKSRSLAESVSGSFETGVQQRDEASKSFQQADSYNKQAMETQTQAATLNANYNQEFFDWLGHQQADHTAGHIGKQGAAHIIANDTQKTMAYAKQFMEEKGLVPATNIKQSASHVKQAYDQDTRHQVHQVTDEPIQTIRQQGKAGFKNNLTQQGQDFRKNTTKTIDTTIMQNDTAAGFVKEEGKQVQNKVRAQKGRSVIKKVSAKAASEVGGTAGDAFSWKKGESQNR